MLIICDSRDSRGNTCHDKTRHFVTRQFSKLMKCFITKQMNVPRQKILNYVSKTVHFQKLSFCSRCDL